MERGDSLVAEIDERIVEMKFDNAQFESGVATTMQSLDKFRDALKLDGISESLSKVSQAMGNLNVSAVNQAAETTSQRFSILGEVATAALWRISNTAITVGANIVRGMTIAPVMDGFREYETEMNSIKTISANLPNVTNDEINSALNELNNYADLTIYSFGNMTDAIGKFTAAGVGLQEATTAIKGMSNVAAGAGVNNTALARAEYQVSQALQSGTIRLMDWNSLVQAGMANPELQSQLQQTAREMGKNVDAAIAKQGSFRDSLTEGWLTADVFIATMAKAADASTEWGARLTEAATVVNTWSQLKGTVIESIGTNWATSWKLILGDAQESKALFSDIFNAINPVIGAIGNFRNGILQTWKDLGGRTSMINSFFAAFSGIQNILTPVADMIQQIFGGSGSILADAAKNIENLMVHFKQATITGEDVTQSMLNYKAAMTGVASVVHLVGEAIGTVVQIFSSIANVVGRVTSSIFNVVVSIAGAFGRIVTAIVEVIDATGLFGDLSKLISDAFGLLDDPLNAFDKFCESISGVITATSLWIVKKIKSVITVINDIKSALSPVANFVTTVFSGVVFGIKYIIDVITDFIGRLHILENAVSAVTRVFDWLTSGIRSVYDNIKYFLQTSTIISDIQETFISFANTVKDTFRNAFSGFDISSTFDIITSAFRNVWETLKQFGGPALTTVLQALVTGLQYGVTFLSKAFDNLGTIISQAKYLISRFDFSSLMNAFKDFGIGFINVVNLYVIPAIKYFSDFVVIFFESVINNFGDVINGLKDILVNGVDGIIQWFKDRFDDIKNFFDNIGSYIRPIIEFLQNHGVLDTMGNTIKNLKDMLIGIFSMSIENVNTEGGIFGVLKTIADVVATISVANLARSLRNLSNFANNIGLGVKRIGKGFSKFGSGVKWAGIGIMVWAIGNALKNIAEALKVVSEIDTGNIGVAVGIVAGFTVLLGAIAILFQKMTDLKLAMDKLTTGSQGDDILSRMSMLVASMTTSLTAIAKAATIFGVASLIVGIAGGVYILVQALKSLTEMDLDIGKVLPALGIVVVAVGAFVGIASAIAKFGGGGLLSGGLGVLAITVSLLLIIKAFNQVKEIVDAGGYEKPFSVIFIALMLLSAVAFALAAMPNSGVSGAASVLILTVALKLIIKEINNIMQAYEAYGIEKVDTVLLKLMGVLGLMGVFAALLGNFGGNQSLKGAMAVTTLAFGIKLIAGSVAELAQYDLGNVSGILDKFMDMLAVLGLTASLLIVVGAVCSHAMDGITSVIFLAGAIAIIAYAAYQLLSLDRGFDEVTGILWTFMGMLGVIGAIVAGLIAEAALIPGAMIVVAALSVLFGSLAALALSIGVASMMLSNAFMGFSLALGFIDQMDPSIGEKFKSIIDAIVDGLNGLQLSAVLSGAFVDVSNAIQTLAPSLQYFSALGPEADNIKTILEKIAEGTDALSLKATLTQSFVDVSNAMAILGPAMSDFSNLGSSADNIKTILEKLAEGMEKLGLQAVLAASFVAVAGALASLGPAVDNYKDVGNAPENIGIVLAALGAHAGDAGPLAGLSDGLGKAARALADLAPAVASYNDVGDAPANIRTVIQAIGTSVQDAGAFGNMMDGIGKASAALQNLAPSVTSFNDIGDAPANIKMVIEAIGTSVQDAGAFGNMMDGIGKAAFALQNLAPSVTSFNSIGDAAGNIKSILQSLGEGAQSCWNLLSDAGKLTTAADALVQLGNAVHNYKDVGDAGANIAAIMTGIGNGLSAIGFSNNVNALSPTIDSLNKLAPVVQTYSQLDGNIGTNIGNILSGIGQNLGYLTDTGSGAAALSASIGPLTNLVGICQSFMGIDSSIGSNIGYIIANLATNLGYMSNTSAGVIALALVTAILPNFASAIQTMSGLDFTGTASGLTMLSTSLATFQSNGAVLMAIGVGLAFMGTGLTIVGSNASAAANGMTYVSSAISMLVSVAASASASISASMTAMSTAVSTGAIAMGNGIMAGVPPIIAGMMVINATIIAYGAIAAITAMGQGRNIGAQFASGISSTVSAAASAASSVVNAARHAFSGASSGAYSAGYNFSIGLANGIRSGGSAVISAAISVSVAALNAAHSALGEHSPSKITYLYGEYFSMGLANGIHAAASDVKEQAVNLAETALSMVEDLSERSFDINPVIAPVLDGSQLQNGINSFFGNGSLGYLGTTNRLVSSMPENLNASTGTNRVIYQFDFRDAVLNNDADMQNAAMNLLETLERKADMYRG